MSMSPPARASQAPVALWVNMSVITPSGFSTRRHSAKIRAIRWPYSTRASAFAPLSPVNRAGFATASLSLSVSRRRNNSGKTRPAVRFNHT